MIDTTIVSIILPTYNGAQFIAGAIESVLTQTYPLWELIIVNDCSTDETKVIVEKYMAVDKRITLLENEYNLGIQKTINKGLQKTKGKYIARIDDDDRWIDTEKLSKQIRFLEENGEYVLIGTGGIIIDESEKELTRYLLPEKDSTIRNKILSKNCFLHSSVVFKKEAVMKFNGYDESERTRHVEDYDLWLKIGTIGKFANLPAYSVMLIDREGSLTRRNSVLQAKHVLTDVVVFKKKYPRFLTGYFISVSRLLFFYFYEYIPFKKEVIYPLKKVYKKY